MKILKISTLCAMMALCLAGLSAQTEDWQWVYASGGLNADKGEAIATDYNGNSFVAGSFTTSASFGSFTLTGVGAADLFVGKMNTAGNWLWMSSATVAGPEEIIFLRAITLAADGNIYLCGSFAGSATFGGTTLTATGSNDVWVAKLDPAGNWLWASKAGGTLYEDCRDIATDSAGNVYVVGSFMSTVQFGNSTITSAGSFDAFFAKLDAAGTWLWANRAGGDNTESGDNGLAIAVDAANDIYVTGAFNGTISFGSYSLISMDEGNGHDIFICKLNSAGTWLWARQAGSINDDWAHHLKLDAQGNIYIAGMFSGFTSFGPDINLQAIEGAFPEIFVAKMQPSGTWLWARQAGGYNAISVYDIVLDSNANLFFTGGFTGQAKFGPEIILNSSSFDIFLGKLNAAGEWQLVKQAGGLGTDLGLGLSVDGNGWLYLTGYFEQSAQFGTQLNCSSAGGTDVWVAKLGSTTAAEDDIVPGAALFSLAQNYPNPFNPSTTISLQIFNPTVRYRLDIYDLKGRRISTLIDGYLSAGQQQVVWNGRDDRGQSLSSGVYFYRLSGGTETVTRKMILSK